MYLKIDELSLRKGRQWGNRSRQLRDRSQRIEIVDARSIVLDIEHVEIGFLEPNEVEEKGNAVSFRCCEIHLSLYETMKSRGFLCHERVFNDCELK